MCVSSTLENNTNPIAGTALGRKESQMKKERGREREKERDEGRTQGERGRVCVGGCVCCFQYANKPHHPSYWHRLKQVRHRERDRRREERRQREESVLAYVCVCVCVCVCVRVCAAIKTSLFFSHLQTPLSQKIQESYLALDTKIRVNPCCALLQPKQNEGAF